MSAAASLATPRRRGRPARQVAGQEPETRRLLLRAGVAALTEKGYSAVGVDEILRAAGVPKGSFYHWFDGKEAFGQALVDAYAGYFARKLDRCLLPASVQPLVPPLQRLRNFVAGARAGMVRHQFRRGCLVGNLGQEMGALPESFRQQLRVVFADWQSRTAACLREAQAQGDLPAQADPAALAEFFWIGWEGAVLRAKLEHSAAPLDLYADGFFALLGAARGPLPAATPPQP